MRKKIIIIVALCSILGAGIYAINPALLEANEFEGNEAQWTETCSSYITDANLQKKCLDYQKYLNGKKQNAAGTAADLQAKISELKGDLVKLNNLSESYRTKIEGLQTEINTIDASISKMEENIQIVEDNIVVKEANVKDRKDLVKERMLVLQKKINTNEYVDFLMGANDLVDFIQKAKSVQSFTDYDNDLIDSLKEEMIALNMDKTELKRIEATLELQKQEKVIASTEIELMKAANDSIIAINQKEEASYSAKLNEVNAASLTLDSAMPSMNFGKDGENVPNIGGGNSGGGNTGGGNAGNGNTGGGSTGGGNTGGGNTGGGTTNPGNTSFAYPVPGSFISAGTWSYPGGGLHLGMDFAAPIGTPIVAPEEAIVLYANNPVGTSDKGWIGVPQGGGNTVFLLMSLNGKTYAMQFAHMHSSMPVKGKSVVKRGEVIGYVGDSGNSFGSHCHIEVLEIKMSVQAAVAHWNSNKDWQFGTGWNAGGVESAYAKKLRPENVFY